VNRVSSPPTNSKITSYRSTKRKIGGKNSYPATNIDDTVKQFKATAHKEEKRELCCSIITVVIEQLHVIVNMNREKCTIM